MVHGFKSAGPSAHRTTLDANRQYEHDPHSVQRLTLMIEPDTVQVTVDDGVVTLTGCTALAALSLTEAVAGVTLFVAGQGPRLIRITR
jgi:hypothetical protein